MYDPSFAVNSANLGDVKIDGQHVSSKQGSNPADCAWIMNGCKAAQGEGDCIGPGSIIILLVKLFPQLSVFN